MFANSFSLELNKITHILTTARNLYNLRKKNKKVRASFCVTFTTTTQIRWVYVPYPSLQKSKNQLENIEILILYRMRTKQLSVRIFDEMFLRSKMPYLTYHANSSMFLFTMILFKSTIMKQCRMKG